MHQTLTFEQIINNSVANNTLFACFYNHLVGYDTPSGKKLTSNTSLNTVGGGRLCHYFGSRFLRLNQ